jgi:hypothetical protein
VLVKIGGQQIWLVGVGDNSYAASSYASGAHACKTRSAYYRESVIGNAKELAIAMGRGI